MLEAWQVLGVFEACDGMWQRAGGHKRKGVSGGERKRVSIGHEMLINPSVLMLDGARGLGPTLPYPKLTLACGRPSQTHPCRKSNAPLPDVYTVLL